MKKSTFRTMSVLLAVLFLLSTAAFAAIPKSNFINETGSTVKTRFTLPAGFARVPVAKGSFAEYLRNLPLKPDGTKVRFFNGQTKPNVTYQAVVDMEIGNKNLQQCADAIIRLRSEYLYKTKQYDKIHFNFTNGFNAEYSKWMKGYRISVHNNEARWVKTAAYSNSYATFRQYLDKVFMYAGSLSLSKELKRKTVSNMGIGDIFILGATPGHCEMIVDMAVNKATGEKIFLLAQSFIPAQDIEIRINPLDDERTPWYSASFGDSILTPEWAFDKTEIMGF